MSEISLKKVTDQGSSKVTLGEVIDEFSKGFQYLTDTQTDNEQEKNDSKSERHTRWYEFGFSLFSKNALTEQKVKLAQGLKKNLADLKLINGEEAFDTHKEALIHLLFNALKNGMVQRFKFGEIKQNNRSLLGSVDSTIERYAVAQRPGQFENMIRQGISQVTKSYPELEDDFVSLCDFLDSHLDLSVKVFYEHTVLINGRIEYRGNYESKMATRYHDEKARETFASNHVQRLTL